MNLEEAKKRGLFEEGYAEALKDLGYTWIIDTKSVLEVRQGPPGEEIRLGRYQWNWSGTFCLRIEGRKLHPRILSNMYHSGTFERDPRANTEDFKTVY